MASVRRGRPRTDALRLKSIRVLGDDGFCSSGAAEDEDLGQPPLQKGREFSLSPDHGVIVV
jgi:hypothetical protein